MDRKSIPCPEPRGQEVKVDVDVDELEDNENGELKEMMPDDSPPPRLLFNRVIVMNEPVMT